jgi:hypothetical protein
LYYGRISLSSVYSHLPLYSTRIEGNFGVNGHMQWLKLYKLAVIMEGGPAGFNDEFGQFNYQGFGHCRYDGSKCPKKLDVEEMWMIDQNMKMHVKTTADSTTHYDQMPNYFKAVAKGRYTKDERFPEGAASVIIMPNSYRGDIPQTPQRLEYVRKQVVAILENWYGPETQLFFWK